MLAPDFGVVPGLGPLIDASRQGFPAAEQVLEDAEPLHRPARPGDAPAHADLRVPRRSTSRELTSFFANIGRGDAGEGRPAAALPAHDEPVQSGEPRCVSAAGWDQPAERVREAGQLPPAPPGHARLREPPLRPRGPPADHERAAAAAPAGRRRPDPRRRCSADRCSSTSASSRYAAEAAPAPPCRFAGHVQLRRRDDAVPARAGQGDDDGFERHRARRAGRAAGPRAGGRAPCSRRSAPALALRLEPSAATDTLVGRGADTYKATERYRERFGDHSVIVLVRGELPNLRPDAEPRRADRARGLPVGQQARGRSRRRAARGSPCAAARAHEAGQGRLRPGDVRQLGGRRDQRPDPGAARSARPAQADDGGQRRAADREGAGPVEGGAGRGSPTRRASSSTPSSCATCCRSTSSTASA